MKKLLVVLICCLMILTFTGCEGQLAAKYIGGNMDLDLEPGQKLELLTWKDESLWILTRDFRQNEEPETHYYYEEDAYGLPEGSITIYEYNVGDVVPDRGENENN